MSADYQMTRAFGIGLYYGYGWGQAVIAGIYPDDHNGQSHIWRRISGSEIKRRPVRGRL